MMETCKWTNAMLGWRNLWGLLPAQVNIHLYKQQSLRSLINFGAKREGSTSFPNWFLLMTPPRAASAVGWSTVLLQMGHKWGAEGRKACQSPTGELRRERSRDHCHVLEIFCQWGKSRARLNSVCGACSANRLATVCLTQGSSEIKATSEVCLHFNAHTALLLHQMQIQGDEVIFPVRLKL